MENLNLSLTFSLLALVGCAESTQSREADLAETPDAVVCPLCKASAGGETSDFGGTPSPCQLFEEEIAVSEEEAVRRGVDMAQVRDQMERKIDAPLFWRENPVPVGSPIVGGFVESERLFATVKLVSQTWIDVASSPLCDGETCRSGDYELTQTDCGPRMELEFELTFETSKTALRADARGRAFLWALEEEPLVPRANAFVDLATLPGNLNVTWSESSGERRGTLVLWFEFSTNTTSGDLRFDFSLDGAGIGGAYNVLQGYWPSPPAELDESGGFEPEMAAPEAEPITLGPALEADAAAPPR